MTHVYKVSGAVSDAAGEEMSGSYTNLSRSGPSALGQEHPFRFALNDVVLPMAGHFRKPPFVG